VWNNYCNVFAAVSVLILHFLGPIDHSGDILNSGWLAGWLGEQNAVWGDPSRKPQGQIVAGFYLLLGPAPQQGPVRAQPDQVWG